MQLVKSVLTKADPCLADAMRNAHGEELLTVVMSLSDTGYCPPHVPAGNQSITSMEDRISQRRAVIEQRQESFRTAYGTLIKKLRSVGLEPSGAGASRVLVVHGPVKALAKALSWSLIDHASLDRPIDLILSKENNHDQPLLQM